MSTFADSRLVNLELELGELRALSFVVARISVCDGSCGKPDCATRYFALMCTRYKLARALEAGGVSDEFLETIADKRAVAVAWLDQRRAELVERGLLDPGPAP